MKKWIYVEDDQGNHAAKINLGEKKDAVKFLEAIFGKKYVRFHSEGDNWVLFRILHYSWRVIYEEIFSTQNR